MCKQTISKTITAQTHFKPWCASCALNQKDRILGTFETLAGVDQRLELCFMEKQLEGLEESYQMKAAYYMRQDKAAENALKPAKVRKPAPQKSTPKAVSKAVEGGIQKAEVQQDGAKAKAYSGSEVPGCTVADLARTISLMGHPMGRNRLYAWLRERNYIERAHAHKKHLPTRESVNMKIMFTKNVLRRVVKKGVAVTWQEPELRISRMGRYYFTRLILIENGKAI
ncbi:MAG: phage antirepressor KilAC domain-containing protein, partial [Eubacterium sp.]